MIFPAAKLLESDMNIFLDGGEQLGMSLFHYQGFNVGNTSLDARETSYADQAWDLTRGLGANTASIWYTLYQDTTTSNSIHDNHPWTGSLGNLAAEIREAKAAGLRVVVKPHIDTLDGAGAWQIDPSDRAAWFADYKSHILEAAQVAQANGADAFVIGTELQQLDRDPALRGSFENLITEVRGVFHGEVGYASTYITAGELATTNVTFWDIVDFVGVNIYPEFLTANGNDVSSLVNAWYQADQDPNLVGQLGLMSHVEAVQHLHALTGKPIMFTEFGIRSLDGAVSDTSGWTGAGIPDADEQRAFYESFFEVWSREGGDWLIGALSHKWNLIDPAQVADQSNTDGDPTDFTVRDKAAADAVYQWFTGQRAAAGEALSGTSGTDRVIGSYHNDTVFGHHGADAIWGKNGADVLYGNQNADIVYGNQSSDTLFGGQDSDTIYGGKADDLLYGNKADDMIYGNVGNDVAYGNLGSDVIYGGAGNDTLLGGQGDDTLVGGLAGDHLVGGLGSDVFRFTNVAAGGTEETDIVRDFQIGQDRLHLIGSEMQWGGNQVITTGSTGGARIWVGGQHWVELVGIDPSSVGSSDFIFS